MLSQKLQARLNGRIVSETSDIYPHAQALPSVIGCEVFEYVRKLHSVHWVIRLSALLWFRTAVFVRHRKNVFYCKGTHYKWVL